MIDPWQHILKSLEPEIDFLKMALENGPKILPRLEQNKKAAWQVCFSPVWSDATVRYYDDIDHKFDKRISWAAEELEKWNAWRNSYDTWVFHSKDEAEKFITFYTLKWSAE